MDKKIERRMEVRASADPLVLEGLPVIYESPADIGGYTETIRTGALDGVDLSDVPLFFNHEQMDIPLARTPGTMDLTVTERGLEMRATLPDTERGREVYEAVRRGDISKMSFAFDVEQDYWNPEMTSRSITQLGRIYEVSLVNRAAYQGTSVTARGGDEQPEEVRDQPEEIREQENNTSHDQEDQTMSNPIIANLETRNAQAGDTHAVPEYRSAFYKSLLGRELTDAESRAFQAAQAERRDDAFNTLTSSAAIIPTETLNEVISQARPQNGLYNEVRMFSVPSNLFVPVGTPVDAAAWHVEGAAVARKDVTVSGVSFTAYELIKILSMSAAVRKMEISAFEKYLTQELRNSIIDALSAAILSGTGSGQPTGILTGITWKSTGTGQNAISVADDEFSPDNIIDLLGLLPAGYSAGAKLAMSTATLYKRVFPFKDAIGRYIFMDPVTGGTWKIFGAPVVIDDNIPADTILYGNFKYYGLNIPQGIAMEVSRESGFSSGLIDYRALAIADGKVILPEAFLKLEISAG